MKKKVCLVSLNGTGNTGGVERVSYYLEQILSEQFDVQIVTKGKFSFGKADKLLYPILIAIKLAFIPEKTVISNSWHSFFYPADISIHHGTTAGSMKVLKPTFAMKVNAFMEKVSAKKSRMIAPVSENCRKELIDLYGIKSEKIVTVPNFVDEDVFFPLKEKREITEPDRRIILFSGTLCERKGLPALLALADSIEEWNKDQDKKGLPEFVLRIATNNAGNTGLFAGKKCVQIETGLTVNDMNAFYNSGDILFFPSLYEGFSMSTLEALASGIPVIGTKAAVPEELNSYDFCRLISNETPEQILKLILDMTTKYNDKKNQIHEQVKKDFGKEQYRKRFFTLLENLK